MTTKKQVATLILAVVGMMGLANAQSLSTIKAQVPFNFVANGRTMPAGECVITVLGPNQKRLSISSGKQHTFAYSIPDESPKARQRTALVFHRYGNQYFLIGIKRDGKSGYEFPAGKLELELQAQTVVEQDYTLLASAE
ncbi:MAG TPA: hypothetical protein VE866_02035 [Candidatus Binatia bacterium]|jgi:hypothetical protein|nr:hypothetical protein [Candidatus Binatia bacterium]